MHVDWGGTRSFWPNEPEALSADPPSQIQTLRAASRPSSAPPCTQTSPHGGLVIHEHPQPKVGCHYKPHFFSPTLCHLASCWGPNEPRRRLLRPPHPSPPSSLRARGQGQCIARAATAALGVLQGPVQHLLGICRIVPPLFRILVYATSNHKNRTGALNQ